LDGAVLHKGTYFTPQGVSLTLWAFAKLIHHPGDQTLAVLANNLKQQLELFKPHELANTIEAFHALDYSPGSEVIAAITRRVGRSISDVSGMGQSNLVPSRLAVTNKPPLSGTTKSTKTSSGVVLPGTEHISKTVGSRTHDAAPIASVRAAPVMLKL